MYVHITRVKSIIVLNEQFMSVTKRLLLHYDPVPPSTCSLFQRQTSVSLFTVENPPRNNAEAVLFNKLTRCILTTILKINTLIIVLLKNVVKVMRKLVKYLYIFFNEIDCVMKVEITIK